MIEEKEDEDDDKGRLFHFQMLNFHVSRHPVTLARHVMENTSHVLVVSGGAERLAEKWGVEQVSEVKSCKTIINFKHL